MNDVGTQNIPVTTLRHNDLTLDQYSSTKMFTGRIYGRWNNNNVNSSQFTQNHDELKTNIQNLPHRTAAHSSNTLRHNNIDSCYQ